MESDEHWRLDKHIPIALIFSITVIVIGQTAALSYGWASMSSRVEQLERQSMAASVTAEVAAKGTSALSERVVEIKTRVDGVAESLNEIKSILRQVPTRTNP